MSGNVQASFTDELQRLPAQPISAMRVMRMVDDPHTSVADLARLVETDPALSAQVMRLANSPYYGLQNSVSSAGRAVVLLGFTTVRALAVSAACGLLTTDRRVFPPGFWPHALGAAVGSAAIARRVGVATSEAFSAGLLHDIGAALLYRRDPDVYLDLVAVAGFDPDALVAMEHREFGADHAEVGGEVLKAWRFPAPFVRAVAGHHRPPDELGDSLARVVVAGEALARVYDETVQHEPEVVVTDALAGAGLRDANIDELLREMTREIGQLAWFLEIEE